MSAQTVRAATYYNLEIDKAGQTASGSATITVNNDFTITNGTFADLGNAITGNSTGTFTVSAGAVYTTTRITTPWLPTNYTAAKIVLAPTSTVNYNGGTAHNIVQNPNGTAITNVYGHLGIASAVIKTVSGGNISANNLTINAGTLNDGGNTISVLGNLSSNGTHTTTGSGKILMQGSTPQQITTTAAATRTFGNIEIDNAAGVTLGGTGATFIYNINTGNTLTLTSGNLNVANATLMLTGNALAGNPALLATTAASNLSYQGSAAGHAIPSSVTNLQNLTLNNANGLSLNSDITMSATGVLTLTNGRLNLGAYDLTILNTAVAAISGGSSTSIMVQADGAGQLKRNVLTGSYVFPVGDNSGGTNVANNNGLDYSPVTLNFTANSAPRIIGIRVVDDKHPSDATTTDYISRHWAFTESPGTGTYTYNATFRYSTTLPSDLVGTHANVKLNSWDTDDFYWTQFTTTGTAPDLIMNGYTETTGPLADVEFTGRVNSAVTYTWLPTSGTNSWTVPANWSPSRFSAQPTDILQFTNGGNPIVSNVPTQTIARLIVGDGGSGNTDVTFTSSAAAQTLTISNTSGTNFDIQAGSTLRLSSTLANATSIAFTGTNVATINGTLVLDANTSGNNTYTATNSSTTVNGAITNNGGTITSTATNLTFGAGAFYNHARNGGAIPLAAWNVTSTCNITGITSTNLTTFTAPVATPFGNLIWNCPAQTITTGGLTTQSFISGNFQILAGTFYDNGNLLNGPGTGTGKTFTIANGATFNMTNISTGTTATQAGSFPLFASYAFGASSTVNYNANATQPIVGNITYGNLRNTNNTKTLNAPATAAGDLIIASGVVNDGGFVLTVQGSVLTDGTHTSTGSGRIRMQGSSAQNISFISGSGTRFFGNIEINSTDNVYLTSSFNTYQIDGTLTLTSGNLNLGSVVLNLPGSVSSTSGFLAGSSNAILNVTGANGNIGSIGFVTGARELNTLTVNRTGTNPSVTLTTPLSVSTLNLTSGIINNSSNTLSVTGSAVSSINGGSATAFINGALERTLPVITVPITYPFPIGKSGLSQFQLINPTTAVPTTVKVEMFDSSPTGGIPATLNNLGNQYWASSVTSGALTGLSNIRLSRSAPQPQVNASHTIAHSSTLSGNYNSIGGTVIPSYTMESVNSVNLNLGYFVIGLNICGVTTLTEGSVTPGCGTFSSAANVAVGTYRTMNVVQGVNYSITTCNSTPSTLNTQLTLRDNSENYLAHNDDNGPHCSGIKASLDWTATYTGVSRIHVHKDDCESVWSGTSAVLQVRQNTLVGLGAVTPAGNICQNGSKKLTAILGGVHSNPVITWSIDPPIGRGTLSSTTGTTVDYIADGSAGTVIITAKVGECSSSHIFEVIPSANATNTGPYIPGEDIVLDVTPSGADTYQWSGPGGFSSSLQSPVIPNAQASNSGIYTVTVTFIGSCTSTSSVNVTVYPTQIVWEGTIDQNWHDPDNWLPTVVPDNCVFDVLIPTSPVGGVFPEVSTSVSVKNLTVNNGARITLSDKLNVCGNITGGNSSTNLPAIIGTSYLELNGGSAQTISGRVQFNT
ncbi:MAG: hypothetical protein KIS94_14605, partial [Chitinophagales bacterium]|nr:hypothetical protein [Chitinophagales bacterium]